GGPMQMSPAARALVGQIHPELHNDVALLLLFVGMLFSLYFLYYEVSMRKQPEERRLLPQLFVALLASGLLGNRRMALVQMVFVRSPRAFF
ncbi:unnamed protein product, partial [Polarella glacialis]